MPRMPLASRVEPRLAPPATTAKPVAGTRSASFAGGIGWGGAAIGGGGRVDARRSEGLSAVTACVELISGSIASLPASIVMDTPDGRQPAPSSLPAWRVLARPNDWQSWPAWVSSVVASVLLHGNAVSAITKDARGAVSGLTGVPWPWLLPQVIRGASGAARLVFDVLLATPEAQLLSLPPRLLADEVLFVRSRSDNAIVGRSVLSRAAGVVAEGAELAEASSRLLANGVRPSGAFSTGAYLDGDQAERAREIMSDMSGALNAGRPILLEGGWSYQAIGMSNADAQFLESRQFNVGEVARLFNVPEILIQTGQRVPATLDPFVTAFATLALAPIVAAIEAEFDAAVLPAGYHLALDMSGLLRGSFTALAAAFATLKQSGIATANDARRAIGLPAQDGGDTLATSAAPSFPADAPGMPAMHPPAPQVGDGLPNVGTHQNEGAA